MTGPTLFRKSAPSASRARLAELVSLSERATWRRAGFSALAMVAILGVGALGYRTLAADTPSWIDSLLMAFITVTTIGYGESVPLSTTALKIFTMALATVGIANIALLTSSLFVWVVQSQSNPLRQRLRMETRIASLSGHYIVCGLGRAGSRIASELARLGKPYVAIDVDESLLNEHPLHARGDASDEDVLAAAGISSCAGVFAATGDDSKNLLISLAARELAPGARIVARAADERNAKRMGSAGANATVCPDVAAGAKLASAMLTPHAHGFIEELSLGGSAALIEARIDEVDAGQTLAAFLSTRPKLAPMALRRGGAWNVNPPPHDALLVDDVLILLSTS